MIIFKKLRYQNLLSTGNQFTELDLCRSASTLVIGENGGGKSTFIDALTFGLYGRPFRNINKPQLVNSITGKNLLVEVEFSIGGNEYLIRRGIKPTIFEINVNGTMINQNAGSRDYQEYLERSILKLNFKSFCQIVVLGSANYVPFMQLPSNQRRAVIEDLLDIQVFSVMNSILKDEMNANKEEIKNVDYQIDLCEQKIELHNKHLQELQTNTEEQIEQKNQKIKLLEDEVVLIRATVDSSMSMVADLNEQISDQLTIINRKDKLVSMQNQLSSRISKLSKDITFFHDHDNCPTCKQGIDHEFKQDSLNKRLAKKDEIQEALEKIDKDLSRVEERMGFVYRTNQEIQKFNSHIQLNNQKINITNKTIAEIREEIDALRSKNIMMIDSSYHTEALQESKNLAKLKQSLIQERAVQEVSASLLKDDGIKTKIIKRYIPIMNKLINKYLASLDFFVNFELDEHFNETIKSRFRDDFSYASFSEGEKLRIDVSLMFAWRSVAKLRNSVATNLLIMDEVFDSSLDTNGTEEFLKILSSLGDSTNTFVISHKGDILLDKFHSIIKFEKHANFSRIAS